VSSFRWRVFVVVGHGRHARQVVLKLAGGIKKILLFEEIRRKMVSGNAELSFALKCLEDRVILVEKRLNGIGVHSKKVKIAGKSSVIFKNHLTGVLFVHSYTV
jgi:hypothetical protein